MSDHWIRASEISTYLYCRRAWWLKRKHGVQSQNVREMEMGTRYHGQHGRTVLHSIWARRLAYVILFIVVAFFVYSVIGNP
jgi:CRISPR/Cas system-associated exonuclease Cas4 (RecB family)